MCSTHHLIACACLLPFVTLCSQGEELQREAEAWISLSRDLASFQAPSEPWKTAGGARLDPKNPRRLVVLPGENVLVNGEQPGGSPNLITQQAWGDIELSLDFMVPRGSNSGVKLHGLYEIQIADSWGKTAKLRGDDCGGVYPRWEMNPNFHTLDDGIPPRRNAARAPGEWQSLRILFRAPRFDAEGKKIVNARFEKVELNGKLIHENVELPCPTGGMWRDLHLERSTGPLLLQGDHGQVAFRNIRIRPLPLMPAKRQ